MGGEGGEEKVLPGQGMEGWEVIGVEWKGGERYEGLGRKGGVGGGLEEGF